MTAQQYNDCMSNCERRENYGSSNLKKLKVDLYHSQYCGWCKKSIAMLKKSGELKNVTLKDVSKPEISAEMKLKKIEGQGVPAYHSNATGKNSIGRLFLWRCSQPFPDASVP